uniref:Uncharacterized protein n=1 Tax=Arundo donax TaxID=35708 RepID=A0A0A9HUS2_ARUDO
MHHKSIARFHIIKCVTPYVVLFSDGGNLSQLFTLRNITILHIILSTKGNGKPGWQYSTQLWQIHSSKINIRKQDKEKSKIEQSQTLFVHWDGQPY